MQAHRNPQGKNGPPSAIGHLPPSAKLVYKVLETGGALTQKDIVRETSLPPRTVRYALNRLDKEDYLIKRHSFRDARQSLYGLKMPGREKGSSTIRGLSIPGQPGYIRLLNTGE
jgi:DNA-binding MarR family transcriptional regulator